MATRAKGLKVLTSEPLNTETDLRGSTAITPNALFFNRNRAPIPSISAEGWKLSISGEVAKPRTVAYEELVSMPSRSMIVTTECAGNGRAAITPAVSGEPWGYCAVSTARWTGVPLAALLREAEPSEETREILFKGGDAGHRNDRGEAIDFERSLPVGVAMGGEALVAYKMNGAPIPQSHGFPVRLVVPGWYGMASVKWLTSISAIPYHFTGFYQKDRYVVKTPAQEYPVTRMRPRSVITNVRDGDAIRRGRHMLRGKAWSGGAEIDRVEISVDGGSRWGEARITSTSGRYMWCAWEFQWMPRTAGNYVIASRARDSNGDAQQDAPEWNQFGYANNAVQRLRVTVS